MKNKINDDFGFYESLKRHYESQKSRAISTIKLYLQEPVGIGEHSDVQVELEKWTNQLATADESLAVLEKYFEVRKPRT
jgi:hypothetical protein